MIRHGLLGCWLGMLIVMAGCASAPRGHVDGQAAARANTMRGMNLLANKQYDKARRQFRQALGYDSNNARAIWGLAVVLQNLGQAQRASALYKEIIKPNSAPELLNSYAAFSCQQGKVDRAVHYFRAAAGDARNQAPAVALANAGLCLEQAGKMQASVAYYRRALGLNNTQITALTRLAHIEYNQGAYLSARAFIERADAAYDLSPALLLLAARTEMALGEHDVAVQYVRRYNQRKPMAARTIDSLSRSS